MNKLFTDEAWDDYTFWFNTDKKILKKINDLIKEIEVFSIRVLVKKNKP